MSALDTLRPGQQGVLALLLRRGQSYDELAGTLDTSAPVVTEMARSAVRSVAPPAADVDAGSLDRLSDYVLGQLGRREADDVTAELERSPAAREWVREAVGALGPLYEAVTPPPVPPAPEHDGLVSGAGTLDGPPDDHGAPARDRDGATDGPRLRRAEPAEEAPDPEVGHAAGSRLRRAEPADGELVRGELAAGSHRVREESGDGSRPAHEGPAERSQVSRPEPAGRSRLPAAEHERSSSSTRRARRRILLLLGALALLLAAVGLWDASRDDDRPERRASPTVAPAGDRRALVERQLTLEPSAGETGAGIIAVSRSGGERQLVVQARLRPSRPGERYELWLYRTKSSARSLGARPTDARGNYRAAVPLPADYATYPSVDLSRETDPRPPHSGDSVLRAALAGP